ncbi:hypothetical protein [Rhodanobacter sp. Root480]|uniref:hypothetical protein n=1 Tax=Rhodanobacter sp. Root480 TaxID=1736542 RepID=UPI0012E36575|nr:hypothetical protein [Rhodanobacter sp. Root480]
MHKHLDTVNSARIVAVVPDGCVDVDQLNACPRHPACIELIRINSSPIPADHAFNTHQAGVHHAWHLFHGGGPDWHRPGDRISHAMWLHPVRVAIKDDLIHKNRISEAAQINGGNTRSRRVTT